MKSRISFYLIRQTLLICVFVTTSVTAQEVDRQIINLDFEGNKTFSSDALREVARDCVAERLDSRSSYNSDGLDCCLRKIRSFLIGKAYLRATVGKPRQEQTGSGATVIIPVEEGLPYRLGEVNIQGARLFSSDQIVGMLGLKRGDLAGGQILTDWLAQKLKHAYANRGYIQFTHDLELQFRPIVPGESEGIVDLSVTVEEGRAFTIRRIIFRGNSHTPDELLLRALLLREGDVFNEQLFEDSIKRLNQLGRFEEIQRNSDIEWKAPRRGTPEMDLILNLKERVP